MLENKLATLQRMIGNCHVASEDTFQVCLARAETSLFQALMFILLQMSYSCVPLKSAPTCVEF